MKKNAKECLEKVITWTDRDGPMKPLGFGLLEDVCVQGSLVFLAFDEEGVNHFEALCVAIMEDGMKMGGATPELVHLLIHQSKTKGVHRPALVCPVVVCGLEDLLESEWLTVANLHAIAPCRRLCSWSLDAPASSRPGPLDLAPFCGVVARSRRSDVHWH